jgi:hypothetical protein
MVVNTCGLETQFEEERYGCDTNNLININRESES